MIDLEGLWRDAKAATPVCAVTGATKNMIDSERDHRGRAHA